jgi:uncharacterized protein
MPDQASSSPIIALADGVQLTVRITPRSRHNEIGGLVDLGNGRSALAVRLAAPPVDGAANALLCRFLAEQLGVAQRNLRLVSGEKSRIKTLYVVGDTAALEAALKGLAEEA